MYKNQVFFGLFQLFKIGMYKKSSFFKTFKLDGSFFVLKNTWNNAILKTASHHRRPLEFCLDKVYFCQTTLQYFEGWKEGYYIDKFNGKVANLF